MEREEGIMADEHARKKYRYRLVLPEDAPLHFCAAETRGNGTEIKARLLTRPPNQGLMRELLGKVYGVKLQAAVPSPLQFESRPRLSIWYHIEDTVGDADDYCAECEFTAEGIGIELQPADTDDDTVRSTIHGNSLRITGKFRDTDALTMIAAYVELVKGGDA
jgi:hypothetical protein